MSEEIIKEAAQTAETAQDETPEAETAQDEAGAQAPKRGRKKGGKADEAAQAETPAVLYGAELTAQKLYALAGVNEGVFPFTLALGNFDGSMLPLPELGEQPAANLHAYAQNVPVTFANRSMVETFVLNINRFAELWGWDSPQRGITVSKLGE